MELPQTVIQKNGMLHLKQLILLTQAFFHMFIAFCSLQYLTRNCFLDSKIRGLWTFAGSCIKRTKEFLSTITDK